MNMKHPYVFLLAWFGGSGALLAQTGPGSLQPSNVLNPTISALGWFQGETGRRLPQADEEVPPLQMKEAEFAFQSAVDPYARADFFVAVEGEGKAALEEGYLTWLALPGGLSSRFGKFRSGFGKFNRIHTPETAFADRPLVSEKYFGEEGLSSLGASLSWHVPNPWLFVSLDGEATTAPEAKETPAFDVARRRDLLYTARLGAYQDLTESLNVSLGGSLAHGPAGQSFNAVAESSTTLRSQLYGVDLTFRWKNPRRAIYRSFLWQTEVLWSLRDQDPATSVYSWGLFSHAEYQFARRWRCGFRYDWSESPLDGSRHEEGGLAYLTFMPSEFSLLSLQGRQVKKPTGELERLGFLKVTFSIGPHGAHPF